MAEAGVQMRGLVVGCAAVSLSLVDRDETEFATELGLTLGPWPVPLAGVPAASYDPAVGPDVIGGEAVDVVRQRCVLARAGHSHSRQREGGHPDRRVQPGLLLGSRLAARAPSDMSLTDLMMLCRL